MSTLEATQRKKVFINKGHLGSYRTPMSKVFDDVGRTLISWRIWVSMGWQDVRLRYKRTKLGPFWITLTTFVFIASMAFIFGNLLNSNRASYLPHLASGYVAWTFISGMLQEASDVFNLSQRYILQMNLPYTLYVMRMVFKNAVTLFHNILPVVAICLWNNYHYPIISLFTFAFGFFILASIGFFWGTAIACVGARFRDLKPGMQSLIRIFFFCTPIMWTRDKFPENLQYVIDYNPFFHLVELLRRPLMGEVFTSYNLLVASSISLLGFILMLFALRRTRHRIAFWV